MSKRQPGKSGGAAAFLAAAMIGLLFPPAVRADVLVLQSGAVVTGTVLQQDAGGVLMQTEYGTYRYPAAWLKELKREPAAAPHVSNNGRVIPDWAQIVSRLAQSGFAPEIKQVPAMVISYGSFKNVPYVSFRCGNGIYEVNIFGDLDQPAAVQIGAMNYLHQTDAEKTNCVNFICSLLADAADRKVVRDLDWNHKDVRPSGGMNFETLLPGEMGSYGGWWVSVCDTNALARARASEAEMLALAQPRVAAVPPPPPAPMATNAASGAAQPPPANGSGLVTTYDDYTPAYGWTAEELANARAAANASAGGAAATEGMVYPRTYTRSAGTYVAHHR